LPDGDTVPESEYVIASRDEIISNAQNYLDLLRIPLAASQTLSLLSKYACKDLAVFNKFGGTIFVSYLWISVQDFIAFLKHFGFLSTLTQHVCSNAARYKDIVHEVAVVYNLQTFKPIRSAYYGVF
jgi:hypothetical protein